MTLYTVQSGDTLFALAQRCNTTAAAIARANGLRDPHHLQVGQTLRLPCAPYPAKPQPAPPAPPTPPCPGEKVYTVQAGDTLFSIATANGTTVETLVRVNRIATPNLIFPGDRLLLP